MLRLVTAALLLAAPYARASEAVRGEDPSGAARAWALQELLLDMGRLQRAPRTAPDVSGPARAALRLEVRGEAPALKGRRYPSDEDFAGTAGVLSDELRAMARRLGPGRAFTEPGLRAQVEEQLRQAAQGLMASMPEGKLVVPPPEAEEWRFLALAHSRGEGKGAFFPRGFEPRPPQGKPPKPSVPQLSYGPEFGKRFVAVWRKQLPALAALRPQNAFVDQKGIEILIDEPEAAGLFDEDWADLRGRKMTINRRMLLRDADELSAKGAAPEAAAELLALKMLPLLAHELRHAMAHDSLAARGAECSGTVLDAELDANLDGLAVARELAKARPEVFGPAWRVSFDEGVRTLVAAGAAGWAGLGEQTRSVYPERSWLAERTREELLERTSEGLAAVRAGRESLRLEEREGRPVDPRQLAMLAEAEPRLEACRKVFSEESRTRTYRAYFADRRAEMGRRLGLK